MKKPTKAQLEAEIIRLSEIVRVGIDESVGKAPCQFTDGGIQMEHWAVKAMVASFAKTIKDAPNYVECDIHDSNCDGWFVVTVQRKDGKSPHALRREAEAEVERLQTEIATQKNLTANAIMSLGKLDNEVSQILGKALGYPWYKDDQVIFPGARETDGVCVGCDDAETLAMQAADRIAALEAERDGWRNLYNRETSEVSKILGISMGLHQGPDGLYFNDRFDLPFTAETMAMEAATFIRSLQEQIKGHCERIAAAHDVIARNAEKSNTAAESMRERAARLIESREYMFDYEHGASWLAGSIRELPLEEQK